jgi:hypothetical protein
MSSEPTAKVLFRVPDEEGGATVETLWATPVGDDQYKLDNSPFYAYGASWEDTVFRRVLVVVSARAFQRQGLQAPDAGKWLGACCGCPR